MKYLVILLAVFALPMLASAQNEDHSGHTHAAQTQPAAQPEAIEAATEPAAEQAAGTQPDGMPELPAASTIHNPKDRLSYFIGINLAQMLAQQKFEAGDFNAEYIGKGINDILSGKPLAMSEADLKQTMMMLQMKMQARMQASRPPVNAVASAKNLADGQAFLAENASKEGVVTTESGLQYKIITAGTGGTPTASDKVAAHYRGTLIDGKEFDSSYGGEPLTIPVGGVIRGWIEALQLMKEGGKWELYIPANLAYGEQGSPPVIGPNATLVFEIELISIVK